jgi:chaperonin GroES
VLIFLPRPLETQKTRNQIFGRRVLEMRPGLLAPGTGGTGPGGGIWSVCPLEENMKFRPLHDRVVVRRVESEEKTKGGIIIPDTAKEKPQEGEVVAVGPGARNERGEIVALDVKVGDRVLFGKWSGTEIKIDGEEFLIMKESDIMGVILAQSESKMAA